MVIERINRVSKKSKKSKKSKNKSKESRKKAEKYKLYIYRFYSDGTVSNSKPCAECSRWLLLAEYVGVIYEIYYTDEHSNIQPYQYDCIQYLPYNTYF